MSPLAEVGGFPLAKLLIVVILVVVAALIVPLNLLPYVVRDPKFRAVPWSYFFLIGMAAIGLLLIFWRLRRRLLERAMP